MQDPNHTEIFKNLIIYQLVSPNNFSPNRLNLAELYQICLFLTFLHKKIALCMFAQGDS